MDREPETTEEVGHESDWLNSFGSRAFLTWLRLFLGLEKLPEIADEWPTGEPKPDAEPSPAPEPDATEPSVVVPATAAEIGHFNNIDGLGWRTGPHATHIWKVRGGKKYPYKGYIDWRNPVKTEKRTHIVVHQTAISFGTTARNRRKWLKRIQSGLIPADLLAKYGIQQAPEETPQDVLEKAAERMALHERFWNTPYHFLALLNGDVLYNNPFDRYTWHGNGSNLKGIGFGVEGHYSPTLPATQRKYRTLTEHNIETCRAAFRLAVLTAREAGAPIEWVTAHRCYSRGRVGDPGEGIWKNVVIPMADELGLKVDYTFADWKAGGRPIPTEWDDRALYAYRERKPKALPPAA